MKNSTDVIVYKVKVSDSILDYTHGIGRYIKEYYIPSLNISFSYNDNNLYVFKTYENRYKSATVISQMYITNYNLSRILEYLEVKTQIIDIIKEMEKI